MKKTLLITIICGMMAVGTAFGAQSMAFTGPTQWNPGTTVSLNSILTFSPYQSVGLSYWLEVPTAIAPSLLIASEQYFTWSDPTQVGVNTAFGGGTPQGARPGYNIETRDLGATSPVDENGNFLEIRDPGTYTISTLMFSIASGAPVGTYTMYTSSLTPRISEVTSYPNISDNNIVPPGMFVFQIVPEPGTLALLGLAALGSGVLVYRRRKATH